jgi:hypothetical protein
MIRLIPLDPAAGIAPVELRPGTWRFGRAGDNDLVLAEPSISGHHGEFMVAAEGARVRDLGSTNGTFLDGERVADAALEAGRTLRLGFVEFAVAAGASAPPAARAGGALRIGREAGESPAAPPPAAAAPAPPDHVCPKCSHAFAKAAAKAYPAGNRLMYACPRCGGFGVPLAEHAADERRRRATFGDRVRDAFRYPLRGNGPALLVGGTVFFGILSGATTLLEKLMGQTRIMPPMVLAGYLILVVLSTGYFVACLQGIITSSAAGEDDMPDWPEVSEFWSDIAVPFFRFLAVSLVLLGPGLAAMFFGPGAGVPVLLLGLVCAPMALLTVAMADSIAGLNPFVIFSGIAKVPGPYVLTCVVLAGLLVLAGLARLAFGLLPVPVLPALVGGFLSLYAMCVGMRVLGAMYCSNRDKLDWF